MLWVAAYAMVLLGVGILIGRGLAHLESQGIEPDRDGEP